VLIWHWQHGKLIAGTLIAASFKNQTLITAIAANANLTLLSVGAAFACTC
jgi:hypothetical protein